MRPSLAWILVALALLAPAFAPPAVGAEERVLTWDYTVTVDDPASGTVDVAIRFGNLKGLVDRLGFLTESHQYTITDVKGVGSEVRPAPGGVVLNVANDVETLAFTVSVNRAAFKAGEYNAYLGPDWGVFRAESLALGFNYSYVEGTPFRWAATVRWDVPAGWSAEMALPRASGVERAFRLPEGEVLPRGFVALGKLDVATAAGAGKEFRLATIGEKLSYEADAFPYLEKATPYYAQVYGPVTGSVLLAIAAPSPMFRGGLGGTDSFYVHSESDLRTLAHEYAHAWQLFGTVLDPGAASVWIAEGDADYHGAISLFVTEYWSLDEVNEFLRGFSQEATKEPFRSTPLVDATYGGDKEDVAYHKGALVLHALDTLMRERTAGSGVVGIDAVLRALNEAHDQRVDEDDAAARQARLSPVTNSEMLAAVNEAVATSAFVDFAPFFTQYVHGKQYPAFSPVVRAENVAFTNLTIAPDRALATGNVTATVRVENRGFVPATKLVPLFLDGVRLGARDVTLDVGESENVTFTFPAGETGEHHVRAFYLEATYRVLTPPRLAIARVATVPETAEAGKPVEVLVYVRNAGELTGEATVSVRADSFRDVGAATREVAGNLTLAFPFTVTFDSSGRHDLVLTLSADGRALASVDHALDVLPADSDGDGVRDPLDAYPDNPRLQEKSVAGDARNLVPGIGWVAVLAVIGLAAHARRL